MTDDALLLPDGSYAYPDESANNKVVEIPNAMEAVDKVFKANRTIAELPSNVKETNPMGLIVLYTILNMTDESIGIALGITKHQVIRAKEQKLFKTLLDDVIESVRATTKNTVKSVLTEKATSAANRLVSIMENGEDKNALKAAESILDRTGNAKNDMTKETQNMGRLVIEIINKSENDIPTVDVTPMEY